VMVWHPEAADGRQEGRDSVRDHWVG
jgi:hypothetical protein